MDDVMDFVEAASERIALYELTVMTPDVRDLADVLVRAAQQVELATKGLRNLKDPQSILKQCIDINRLENESDQILRRAVARCSRRRRTRSWSSSGRRSTRTSRTRPIAARTSPTSSRA
jgi:uncharacterized protein Yka (UPF0111/DUF47 family)